MKNKETKMNRTELNAQLIETRLCTRGLALAIRGHFSAASEGDGEALECLALQCVEKLDALLEMSGTASVVLASIGPNKIEVMKEVRGSMRLTLMEAKALVEAAPTTLRQGVAKAEADALKEALERVGAGVVLA
jgi:large subunit ribosomal protein L7/L12